MAQNRSSAVMQQRAEPRDSLEDDGLGAFEPKHWMPLPAPPVLAQQGEGERG